MVRPLASLMVASCLLCTAPAPAAPRQTVQQEIKATDRPGMSRRFFAESLLTRDELLAALDGLERPLTEPVLAAVFSAYAEAAGRAEKAALDAMYLEENGDVRYPPLSPPQLAAIAAAASKATAEATDAAVRELAQSGATAAMTEEQIAADLYRRLASRKYMSALSGYHRDGDPGYDTLADYQLALRVDRGIADAASRAAKDTAAKAAFDAAVASYRATGEVLGRRVVEASGRSLIAPRILWGGPDPEPADFGELTKVVRADQTMWAKANDSLGVAIASYLTAGISPDAVDPYAASRWRLRHLEATASRATVVVSWAMAIADAATVLGASEAELAAMRAVVDQSLADQVSRMEATLAAYQAWVDAARAKGVHPYSTEPTPALMQALERQTALDRATRERVLATVQSPLLAEALRAIVSPEEGARMPGWVQRARSFAAEEARRANEQPTGGASETEGGAK